MAEPNGGDSGKRRPAGSSGPCRPQLLLDRLYMIVFDGMDSALARLLFLLLLTTGPMTDDTSCSVVACPLLPHARWVLHLGWASSSSTSTWQGWTACAFIAFALLVMLYYMVASTASCPWMARGFIYFVAFVLFTVIDSGMTWTTWRSLACASGRLLAFLAWLHLLRRLRGPCGALLHDGVGCSELDGWCSLTSSCFVGADAGPLRQSWRRFALGPLCPARVANYLVAFVPLAVTYGEKAWTTSSTLAGASWCPLAFSAWLHQLRRLRDPGGALLHDGLGCFELWVDPDAGPLRLSRRWFALGATSTSSWRRWAKTTDLGNALLLGVEAWCFSFGGFGSLVLHLQSQVLLFHCRRLGWATWTAGRDSFWFWGSCLLLLRRL